MAAGSVKRADARANIERILAAAEQLFAQQAIEDVPMEEIATTAGVGKGTLYRHFPTKGELCLALLQAQLLHFQTSVLDQLDQVAARGESKISQILALLEQALRFNDTHLTMLFAIVQYTHLRIDTKSYPVEWEYTTLRRLLEEAVQTGELAPQFDVTILADLLIAPLRPPILRFYRQLRGYSLEQINTELDKLVRQLVQPG